MADRRPSHGSNSRSNRKGPKTHGARPGNRPPGGSARPAQRPAKPQAARARTDAPRATGGASASGEDRLQKILAHAGVGSRRACEELILQGRVTVDGQVVRELGTKVDPRRAKVAVDGEPIHGERLVYYAVHKPKGYVSTNNDPSGRPRVVDLLAEIPERVYAVGRLDEQSTGLMLLMNDGELANRLAHPKFGVEKLYRIVVAGEPGNEVFDKLLEGVWLAEGKVRAKRVRPVARKGQSTVLEMTLAEGKNREIRRMLAKLGHKVMSLTRIAVGPVALKGLGVGESRLLTAREIDLLKQAASGEYVPFPHAPDRRPRQPRGTTPAPRGSASPGGGSTSKPPRPQAPSRASQEPPPRTGRARPSTAQPPERPLGPPPSERRAAARPARGERSREMDRSQHIPGDRPPRSGQGPMGRPPRPASGPPAHAREGSGAPPPPPAPRRTGRTTPPPAPRPRPPARPMTGEAEQAPPQSSGARRSPPARPSGPPRRIIIGLNQDADAPEATGLPGGRRRPLPKRAPRSSFGMKRTRRKDQDES